MAENMNQAWVLLGVGMLTVFIVLLLVVLIGNATILFTNRFAPSLNLPSTKDGSERDGINSAKISAIVAAVKKVTGGKGDVINIEKKQ